MGKRIHIVPHERGWAVTRKGADQSLSTHRTQGNAEKAAQPVARREQTELVTHDQHGRIRDSDSYGCDPNPPEDCKH